MISSNDDTTEAAPLTNAKLLLGTRLFSASQIDCEQSEQSPLALILNWVRNFLSKPHAELGRSGPVCPYTPQALTMDTIWLTEIADSTPDPDRIAEIIEEFRSIFMKLEPKNGPNAINKAIMIVFPNLGITGAAVVDDVQLSLKKSFVDVGLMLGEFHLANESPGLRNENFRPLRSPLPMLAIRHMVESDLPFMRRSIDDPALRASYLRSYLRILGPTLRRNCFEQAIEGLVEAELQLRSKDPLSIASNKLIEGSANGDK